MPFTRNEIVEPALVLVGAKAGGEEAQAADLIEASKALNAMIKTWSAKGLHLFSREDATLFLQPAQVFYEFGTASTDHATESFTRTTLSVDALSGATTVSLTDDTGLAVSDNLGIKLDGGSVQWTTVSSLGPLVFTPALTDDAASGNTVYFYTTDIGKPLRIPAARRQQGTAPNAQEIEMVQLSRSDYDYLPNKSTSGTPVQFYYDPKQIVGNMFVWPAPTSTDTIINMTIWKQFDTYDTADDEGVFPDEWGEALQYNLAVRIAPHFGPGSLDKEVKDLAEEFFNTLMDWDQGMESIFFQYGPGRGQ